MKPILKVFFGDKVDDNKCFYAVLMSCIIAERMDILSYIHKKIEHIDTGMCRLIIEASEENNIRGVANLRRTLSRLP